MNLTIIGAVSSQGTEVSRIQKFVQCGLWMPYVAPSYPFTVTWDYARYDQENMFSLTNPTRLTIPVGVTRVRLKAKWRLGGSTSNSFGRFINFLKNDIGVDGGGEWSQRRSSSAPANTGSNHLFLESSWLPVVAGDYLEVRVNSNNSGAVNRESDTRHSFFEMEYY